MRKRWLIPAILLFALAVLLVTRNNSSDKNSSLAQGNRPPSKSQNLLTQSRSQTKIKSNNVLSVPRSIIEPSPNFPDRRVHTSEELKNFHIPELELSSVTLSEAVEALLQAYADICAHTNEQPLNLNITLPNDLDTRVDFHFLNRSFLSALLSISTAYESIFELSDSELSLTKISELPAVPAGQLVARRWSLPPSFSSNLNHVLQTNDPEASAPSGPSPPSRKTLLTRLGIAPENILSSQYPDSSFLVSEQSEAALARLDFLIENVFSGEPLQHRQESTLISTTRDLGLTSGYYLPDQLDQQLATINSNSNTSLEVAPTVLARPGETATIELTRELITPATDGGFDNNWTGLQIRSRVDGYGFGYRPVIDLESRLGPDTLPDAASLLGDAKFHLGDIAPGPHALVQHQTTPDGQHQYVITRISQIDATGRPIAPRESSAP